MAKYKNWYLARGSGMKDERKKLKLIILQCIAVITANFITIWYFEELFFRGFWYVIFASFILTFIYIIRSFCCLRKIRVFWFAAIPVFLFGIYLAFLFNDAPVYNFINDRLVDESAVLRPLSWHLILYVFRYFSRKWQKISVYGFPDLIQNETPVHFLYGI